MNIYQSNTYRKDLRWLYCDNEPKAQEGHQVKDQLSDIICFCSLSNTLFELVSWFRKYQFLFFTMQFFPSSLKIVIPKHNIKWKRIFYFNFREKLCFADFNTRICWNRSLAASGLFFLFAQSNKFYKFQWHMLRKRLFIK